MSPTPSEPSSTASAKPTTAGLLVRLRLDYCVHRSSYLVIVKVTSTGLTMPTHSPRAMTNALPLESQTANPPPRRSNVSNVGVEVLLELL